MLFTDNIYERNLIMKKIIALALALLMVFALVGCKSNRREVVKITLSTEDSEAILAAAGIRLPDVTEAAGANSVVTWYGWYDPFQNYSEDEIVNTGYFTFQEKYGCSLEWIECDYFERNDMLATLVLSSNSPDITQAGYGATATFPLDCIKGMYVPVDNYVDYENDPLWNGIAMADYYKLGNKHFAFVVDIDPSNVVCYNKRVMDEWGFDDPAELYYNDEWTWDVFYDMCMDFTDGDENRYALDGYAYNGGFVESTGQMYLGKDENGMFYSNIDAPEIERAQTVLYDLIKNDCAYHEGSNRWALRGDFGTGMKDGLCLFYVIGTSFFTGTVEDISAVWGDMEAGEVMFAPLPRDPNGDGNYYMASGPVGYMLISGGDNHDGAALLAKCVRFKLIDPTVIDIDRKQLEEIYLWNDDMLAMYDEQFEIAERHPVVNYTGNLQTALNNALSSLSDGINRSAQPSTYGQLKENNRETIDYYIEELNGMILDYEEAE